MITITEKIQLIIKRKGIRAENIAAALDCSVQNVYKKLKRDKWSSAEIEQWARLIGCTPEVVFTDNATGEKL